MEVLNIIVQLAGYCVLTYLIIKAFWAYRQVKKIWADIGQMKNEAKVIWEKWQENSLASLDCASTALGIAKEVEMKLVSYRSAIDNAFQLAVAETQDYFWKHYESYRTTVDNHTHRLKSLRKSVNKIKLKLAGHTQELQWQARFKSIIVSHQTVLHELAAIVSEMQLNDDHRQRIVHLADILERDGQILDNIMAEQHAEREREEWHNGTVGILDDQGRIRLPERLPRHQN